MRVHGTAAVSPKRGAGPKVPLGIGSRLYVVFIVGTRREKRG